LGRRATRLDVSGDKPAFTGFEFDYNCVYAPPELPLKFS